MIRRLLLALIALLLTTTVRAGYNRDIRPILAENCFACHGPDSASRKADLRLDRPGWDARKLIARVMASDVALRMPPANSHKTLTTAQKAALTRWARSGAAYEPHWSFIPPRGSAKSLDSLVQARLQAAGLSFSPEASREEWLRRVSLDLTGLPPTIAEQDAFLADGSARAYEKVVDRLLFSPRFGEQMALPWLDLARYGDSYGYQSDQLETVWPWRDWVVRAFNEGMPYDRFVTEQLAGDLLPDASAQTRLATTFNRLHRMTNEGGSVPEEWRLEGVADRVKTFGTAFLGLTLECARCHDHKFDPISQREYYQLSAFFNAIDEHGLYDAAHITPTPSLLLPTREQTLSLAEAKEAVRQAERALEMVKARRKPAAGEPVVPLVRQSFETLDGVAHAETVPLVEGIQGKAISLDGENNVHFPNLPFTRHTPFTISFWLKDTRGAPEPVVLYSATSGTDTGPYGYDLTLHSGVLTAKMMRHWPGNAIAVQTREPVIKKGTWTRITVTYDGSSRAAGLKIYVNASPVPQVVLRDRLYKGVGTHTLVFGQRFRDKGFKGGLIDELTIYDRALEPEEVASGAAGAATSPEERAAMARLSAARERVWRAEDAMLEVMCMEEMPTPRPTYVLARGAYDAEKTEKNRVGRGTPAFLPPLPGGVADRRQLARWLTDKNHPLTARVAVNRFWQQLFGVGLVETSDDFGVQGRLPENQPLLDALAVDFARDWNVRRLLKTIVLSQTYRQSSAGTRALRERDPQNRLLARGPSGRLSAETVRDLALAAAGLLDSRLGGPPVSPYQPGDLWREANSMSPAFRQSVGPDLWRRSLYTVVKRTAPMANMTAFDMPGREVCTARRSSTSTPLQALVLLNDTQFVEAARVLGERMLREGGQSDETRATFAFRLLAARRPTRAELSLLTALYAEQRKLFGADPAAAQKLLAVGEKKPDPALSPTEVAAATSVAQAILNLDAVLWKR